MSKLILVISLFLKCSQINGVNLLSVEYDRMNHTESILNKDSQNILWIMYDDSGLPVQFLPCSDHHAMNITYNQRGQITHWQYGEMWEDLEYNRDGLLLERSKSGIVQYRFNYRYGKSLVNMAYVINKYINQVLVYSFVYPVI